MVSVPVPPIPKDAAKDFHDKKIVIIGAGVAGLFAANTLKYLGVDDYVVLEASDRVGGRLKRTSTSSDKDKDSASFHTPVPLDLGAEWIHAADERMVKDLLVFAHDAEKELLPEDFVKYQPSWTFASKGGSKKKTSKVLQALYQETKWKRSTWWDWLNTHVYMHVQDKVRLNSPVQKIVYGTSSGSGAATPPVTVLCQDGTEYKADKVICTIPLAVLKQGDAITTFDPPLPAPMRAAMDAMDMPPGCKILFQMKEKFYPDVTAPNSLWKTLWNGNDLLWIYDAFYGKDLESDSNNHQEGEHVLAFIVVGNKHAQLLGGLQGDDESIVQAALAKIDQVFDGQGTKNYISHAVQNWTTEPYILGGYSLPESLGDLTGQLTGLGSGRHRRALGKTLDDQILFAGEHTSLNYFSLVPGAALEGRRAAVEAVSGVILKK